MIPAPAGRRLVRLALGLVLYALSIAMLVDAGLGNMPWDVLSQGVSGRTGASFGTVTIAISALVLACWIPLRQRPGFGTVANVLVIGVLVDPFLALLGGVDDLAPGWRVLVAAAGIALNGLATALYVGAGLGPGPRDGLMTGLVARTGWSVAVVRTSIEVVVVATGMLLGGRFGVATIAYALLVGPLVHVLLPRLRVDAAPSTRHDAVGPAVDHDDRPDRAGVPERR